MDTDANGLNAAIKANLLTEEEMRELGFTDYSEKSWYFCRSVGTDITFNVSILKDGGQLRIDVLDEDFGQPYDYQMILEHNPKFAHALKVKANVERYMSNLTDAGVITGWKQGDYI